MNDAIQDLVNGLAWRSDLMDAIGELLAKDLIFLAIPVVLALWFLPVGRERALNQRLAGLACVSVLVAIGLGALLGHVYYQDRPFVSDASTKLLIPHGANNGFPSNHATAAFALAGALLVRRRLFGGVLFGVACVLGVARIFVGVHWPSDILAGAVLGVSVGVAMSFGEPLLTPMQAFASRYLPRALVAQPE